MQSIDGSALTTFEVTSDGGRFQMNMRTQGGDNAFVSLPSECLHQLIMTLPSLLRKALWNQFRDSSLRLVYPLDKTRIEKVAGKNALIVTLASPDGFEVSFEYNQRQLDELAGSIAGIDLACPQLTETMRKLD